MDHPTSAQNVNRANLPDEGAEARPAMPVAVHRACPNCGVNGPGPWCSGCGQWNVTGEGAARQQALTQWARIRHSLVALILRPGLLTAEFRDGQRARAIAPWRLAFNAISVFFVLSFVTGFSALNVAQQEANGKIVTDVAAIVQRTQLPRDIVVQRVERRFNTVYTGLMSLSVASYALLFGLTHRRIRQGWAVHGVFALHLMAWVFIGSIPVFGLAHALGVALSLSASHVQTIQGALAFGFLLLTTLYLMLGFRRVYGDGWRAAALKAILVSALGTVVDSALFGLALGITIGSM